MVAYDGPARMDTVHGWIAPLHKGHNIPDPPLPRVKNPAPPLASSGNERLSMPAPSVDGIYVLGKGSVQFDNMPFGFINDRIREQYPRGKWAMAIIGGGGLFYFFLQLTQIITGVSYQTVDFTRYMTSFRVPREQVGFGE